MLQSALRRAFSEESTHGGTDTIDCYLLLCWTSQRKRPLFEPWLERSLLVMDKDILDLIAKPDVYLPSRYSRLKAGKPCNSKCHDSLLCREQNCCRVNDFVSQTYKPLLGTNTHCFIRNFLICLTSQRLKMSYRFLGQIQCSHTINLTRFSFLSFQGCEILQ